MINMKLKKLESIKGRFGITVPVALRDVQSAGQVEKIEISANDQKNDVHGNNAAVTCPVCGKVFIISDFLDKGVRVCPQCKLATGHITQDPPHAWVEYDKENLKK